MQIFVKGGLPSPVDGLLGGWGKGDSPADDSLFLPVEKVVLPRQGGRLNRDGGDFHAYETVQGMVERRARGECGVQWMQAYGGDAFWQAHAEERWSHELLQAGLFIGLGEYPNLARRVWWDGSVARIECARTMMFDLVDEPLKLRPTMLASLTSDDGANLELTRARYGSPTLELLERIDGAL